MNLGQNQLENYEQFRYKPLLTCTMQADGCSVCPAAPHVLQEGQPFLEAGHSDLGRQTVQIFATESAVEYFWCDDRTTGAEGLPTFPTHFSSHDVS